MSLISVIVPYFKKKKFISKAINSILKQSYKNIEIIIVYDDPSNIDLEFVKKLIKKNKKILLIINNKNYGAGISRNIGIKKSRGKFVAFLDADDYWHKNKLEIQLKFMKKNKCIISHTDYSIIDEQKKIKSYRKAKILDYKTMLKSCDIGLSTVMIKKEVLKDKLLFPKLKTKEDFVLWLKITKKYNCDVLSINHNLTNWRKTSKSLSDSTTQKILDAFKVYHYYCNFNIFKSIYYVIILSTNYIAKALWKY